MQALDIAIAGEINLDLILDGIGEAMPVERELLASAFHVTLGSSSAILAHNSAALGLRVGFATLAGKDEFAHMALAYLKEQGVDLSAVRQDDGPSSVTVLVNHGGTRHILTYPGTTPLLTRENLDLEYLCRARHFHLSSLFLLKGLHKDLPELLQALKRRGLTISLDTNDDPADRWDGVLKEILPLVDVLLPNEREALRIAGKADLDDALAALSGKVKLIVVKRGAAGVVVRQGKDQQAIAGMAVTPVDTIGAGDSFNAGFLCGFVRGLAPADCALLGNIVGAVSTLKPGGVEAFRDKVFLKTTLAGLASGAKLSALFAGG